MWGVLRPLPGCWHLESPGLPRGSREQPCGAQGLKETCCAGGLGAKQALVEEGQRVRFGCVFWADLNHLLFVLHQDCNRVRGTCIPGVSILTYITTIVLSLCCFLPGHWIKPQLTHARVKPGTTKSQMQNPLNSAPGVQTPMLVAGQPICRWQRAICPCLLEA